MAHSFKIGRHVTVRTGGSMGLPLGLCEIVRIMPMTTDEEPRYHVKCGSDGLVRALPESRLEAATRPD